MMLKRNLGLFLLLLISLFKFSQSAITFCAESGNEGLIKWHESDCNRYYRCWNGNALSLTCPVVAPQFDSCRLQCINDPINAVCGDPGDQCPNVVTTTQDPNETTTTDQDQTTTTDPNATPTVPTAPTIRPTAPTAAYL